MNSLNNSSRHAYLIIAHNHFDQLQLLIDLLDDPRNDIFLHIDKKVTAPIPEFTTRHAGLSLIDPVRVTWGGHSQIACEMRLFSAAAPGHYMYYHLISGLDLPIKTQDDIHHFFQKHRGQSFINLDSNTDSYFHRTQYYHFFQNIVGRNQHLWAICLRKLDFILADMQAYFHIRRKEFFPLYKGANWVSITDDMLQYIVGCKKQIRKQFRYSYCADELFLQSVAMYSPYRDAIIPNYCREIDWNRGEPYIFRKDDFPQLLASSALFARKFDISVDREIIDLLANHLRQQ